MSYNSPNQQEKIDRCPACIASQLRPGDGQEARREVQEGLRAVPQRFCDGQVRPVVSSHPGERGSKNASGPFLKCSGTALYTGMPFPMDFLTQPTGEWTFPKGRILFQNHTREAHSASSPPSCHLPDAWRIVTTCAVVKTPNPCRTARGPPGPGDSLATTA